MKDDLSRYTLRVDQALLDALTNHQPHRGVTVRLIPSA